MSVEFVNIAKQPVIDSQNRLFANEWLYRDFENRKNISLRVASSQLLLTLLNRTSYEAFENDSQVFLNIDTKFLASGLINALPKKRFIFDLNIAQEFHNKDREMLLQLCQHGYRFSLDNVDLNSKWFDNADSILPLFSFIKVDISTLLQSNRNLLNRLKSSHTIIAHKIEDMSQNALAKSMPFHYFQGYYIAYPDPIKLSIEPLSSVHLHQLYIMLQSKENLYTIAEFISSKNDLNYYILQFCNHCDLHLDHTSNTMHTLLKEVGYGKLINWVLMLIYAKVAKN